MSSRSDTLRHAMKQGFVVIGGKKITALGTKKRERKTKKAKEYCR